MRSFGSPLIFFDDKGLTIAGGWGIIGAGKQVYLFAPATETVALPRVVNLGDFLFSFSKTLNFLEILRSRFRMIKHLAFSPDYC